MGLRRYPCYLVPPLACPSSYHACTICAHQVGFFARHLVRLVRQGVRLHETGEVLVRLPDPEHVRELGECYADRPELAAALLADAESRLNRPGVLPTAPDEAPAEAWLRRVRAAYFAPVPQHPGVARQSAGQALGITG